jgi:hypothetical protein
MKPWFAPVLVLMLAAAPVFGDEARIFVTWGAPHGRPQARENVDAACDTTQVDTLYLSVDPGRDAPALVGMSATLYFHAAEGQALPDFWKIPDMNKAGSPLKVIFGPDAARGFSTPWTGQGMGQAQYDFSAGSGRLRMIYAIPAGTSDPVKRGKTYGVARVLVRRPSATVAGCGAPVCIEWHVASLAFGPGDEPLVNHGARLVALNSADGAACAPFRSATAPGTWKPKTAKP